ncbi:hypothetical protein BDN71DRAFT_1527746 [Pleurotus eryngii]|uniref:Uncharacterized protein n=1 Tax=Pleurotus eryngii TaxID=5323 RepID=A0A9P6D3E8_PLEER|nr:hypothetical protein BDN71DRAFT_1527746 [Pleurotus eryngii]
MAGLFYEQLSNRRFSGQLSTITGRRRVVFILLGSLALFFIFASLHPTSRDYISKSYYDLTTSGASAALKTSPPTYERLRKYEKSLPQHNLDLPFPEGRTGRYVKFTNQIKMLGWNNVQNEVLMNAHLAYESKRAYVFQDYVWKADYYPWPESQFRENPPRTPLAALIAGPVAGGPWPEGDNAPRSISEPWFDVVCPQAERRIINTREVKGPVGDAMGSAVFQHWKDLLLNAPERCIEIIPADRSEDGFPQTFDLWLWGSYRVLDLWESFSKSPVSTLLGSSPIVNSAVDRNEYLFLPRGPRPAHPISPNPYDRMLAMHVRRGDFKEACIGLATWNSTFYSWNLFSWLPDRFTPPPGGEWGSNTPENTEKYMEHCLPPADAIVAKARQARADYQKASPPGKTRALDVMYILSNDASEWMDALKQALRNDGWHTIATSKDLTLDEEQTDVNMAVDMDIARRAAVFIGNGWSSFTSNIVHRRLADGREAISNRFW